MRKEKNDTEQTTFGRIMNVHIEPTVINFSTVEELSGVILPRT